jgi:hypothetical protein
MELEKIILGHNPLFGVDHLSQERGNQKEFKFEDRSLITDVLLYAHDLGVNAMMMSSHPRAEIVVNIIKNNPNLSHMKVYPLLPYIAKYVRQANEKGITNLVIDVLSKANFSQKFSMLINGAQSILGKDIDKTIRLLIDIEFLDFKNLNIGAIFIHDSLTDLALGLGAESALEIFKDQVENKYKVPAGFITKNVDNFRTKVEKRGWKDYLVMASINKTGFFVNPNLNVAINAIEKPGMNFIGMSTLSGGALKPEEAYQFLGKIKNLHSVVVGMSQREHIKETVDAINMYLK